MFVLAPRKTRTSPTSLRGQQRKRNARERSFLDIACGSRFKFAQVEARQLSLRVRGHDEQYRLLDHSPGGCGDVCRIAAQLQQARRGGVGRRLKLVKRGPWPPLDVLPIRPRAQARVRVARQAHGRHVAEFQLCARVLRRKAQAGSGNVEQAGPAGHACLAQET